jgi:2-amino-4-hydroxy-6-hydroxymethyldihydropteridine diphosphokinase
MLLERKIMYLLLGSNLGDSRAILEEAIRRMNIEVGEVFARSAWYETAAWGNEDQPSFLNIAVGLNTTKTAHQVLDLVLAIEEALGRVRKDKWGARLIDIDLILYDDAVINDGERLQVPHPFMQERRFVLEPLAEIAGNVIHPVLHQNILTLLSALADSLTVTKIS